MKTFPVLLCLLLAITAHAGETLHVGPGQAVAELGSLRDILNSRPEVSEVIVHKGTYFGSLGLSAKQGVDYAAHPLLIRAADDERVVIEGASAIGNMTVVEGLTGVYSVGAGKQQVKEFNIWDAGARIRYQRVADRAAVAFFPASYTIENETLFVHTHDNQPPAPGSLRRAIMDFGFFINRPYVTVRGIHFRGFLLRDKYSTAIDLRTDHITVEDCTSENASLGFIVTGNDNIVRRCVTRDCGGGIYVGGNNATVEDCRLFKLRDEFMVPMYAQDDTGIQYYYPALGGTIRGNLCIGFGMGIFIKAPGAPYIVEHNTIDGAGQGLGFGATGWSEGEKFRFNILYRCARQIDVPPEVLKTKSADLAANVFWSPLVADLKPIGERSIVADPKFVGPQWEDYRLANDSPALKLLDETRPAGAFAAVGDASPQLGKPSTLHVSAAGRDGFDGSEQRPWRTIQHAVDRARPGDTVLVHPGIYPEPVSIKRGGVEGRPLIIRAAEKWKAILDSNRRANIAIDVRETAYVEIHDLEIRWYKSVAIAVVRSEHVTVAGCRIWNDHWGGWPTGSAVRVEFSPHLTAHHNVLFRQEKGLWLYNSPHATLMHNTAVKNLYSGIGLLYSSEGTVVTNNLLAWNGNDSLAIEENVGKKDKFNFTCDYNLYVTDIRQFPAEQKATMDSLAPPFPQLASDSKAIFIYSEYKGEANRRIRSLKEWREFTGLDAHSFFADPKFAAPVQRDFHLQPGSPAVGAGQNGTTIGALYHP